MKPYGLLLSLTSISNQRTLPGSALYLEAMEDVLPGVNKIIVSPEAESVLILGAGQDGALVPVPVGPNP